MLVKQIRLRVRMTNGWMSCIQRYGHCEGWVGVEKRLHLTEGCWQVTTDIYDDVERQNLTLDETVRGFVVSWLVVLFSSLPM